MESKLVSEFTSVTNCDQATAYKYLQSNCWNVEAAFESWRYIPSLSTDGSESKQNSSDDQPPVVATDVKKLSRGISRATDNLNLVSRARREFAKSFEENPYFKLDRYFIDTPDFTFTLPDFNIFSYDFKKFIEKDIIEKSTLLSLEQSGRLNWWSDNKICGKLYPLATTGDGNCLLHAASLAMWGFHDRLLTLRKALHNFLKCSELRVNLYRRWRWQQSKINEQSGFGYSEEEWAREWQNIINMASTEPRRNFNGVSSPIETSFTSASVYESLEEVHVLALAHVLRRPIIIVSDVMLKDMNNQPFAPISFGGIYLPLDCSITECHRSPLILAYDMAHFSALVAMENENQGDPCAVIPLTDSSGVLLPVQFSVDPGPSHIWTEAQDQSKQHLNLSIPEQIDLVKQYLEVVDVLDVPSGSPDLESEDEGETDSTFLGNKNRAAKQLQSVARQFGSIGKSMSKRIKKNFGSITITKPKTKKVEMCRFRILYTEIHTKRHEYQEEMIKNYLRYQNERFFKDAESGMFRCINAGCQSFGTAHTSYMCNKCYETQRQEELSNYNNSKLNSGKSKFYDGDDPSTDHLMSHLKRKPVKVTINMDRTIHLAKSTFYYDRAEPFELAEREFEFNNDNEEIFFENNNSDLLSKKEETSSQSLLPLGEIPYNLYRDSSDVRRERRNFPHTITSHNDCEVVMQSSTSNDFNENTNPNLVNVKSNGDVVDLSQNSTVTTTDEFMQKF